ncbi:glycoside hydrolase family 5 protein [Periconia macrospinosa]|uniref:glucan 1,3-beta-glucosidase n=1 Tax=Periconia macrospinosa TaxID=97972 RepID=A0A2V1DJV5_9PLEO|nr:glycoside hydrolase family 5 protein [Periconia macrospinosa]
MSDRERDRDRERRRRRQSRQTPVDDDEAQERRRRGHRARDSQGEFLLPSPQPRSTPRHSRHQSDSERESSRKPRARRESHSQSQSRTPRTRTTDSGSGGGRTRRSSRAAESPVAPLSLDALGKLDKANAKAASGWMGTRAYDYDEEYLKEVRRKEEKLERDRMREEKMEKRRERKGDGLERDRERERDERKRERRKSGAAAAAAAGGGAAVLAAGKTRRGSVAESGDERERRRRRESFSDVEREDRRRRREERLAAEELVAKKERRRREREEHEQKKRRVVSGPLAEEGGVDDDSEYRYMMEKRGGAGSAPSQYSEEELARRKKKKKWIIIAVVSIVALLAIIIPVAVVAGKKKEPEENASGAAATGAEQPANKNLDGKDRNSVPEADRGGILDPWSWYDTTDFNVTYTSEKVGGLPIMGLNSTWNDDVQCNDAVPNLQKPFEYGKMKVRGVNVGGWLNLEPFITPSFFEKYGARENIVDEWTLCTKLGAAKSKETLEKHYATFITKQTFSAIRAAGFDHVRIPFGYWMIETYDNDPYVAQVSWRYFLRGIEYARQNGLRVNLDMHGAPGSQNGWNHSGRQGVIGWLNGTDGDTNAQRWLSIHHKLSVFFSQPRYKNLVTMYGLVNEPRMVDLDTSTVVKWTQKAITQIRADNITAILIFGDGFLGLDNWQGQLQNNKNLLLDVHQYVIFNIDQLSLSHTDKLNFACKAWTQQSLRSSDTKTGFGPTMCGEWSQADTDCTQYINNVNTGTRWEGTYNTGNASTSILKPQCPAHDSSCSCSKANDDPSSYSDAYKKFLYQFAVAQMQAFEAGWGWFYWTWETERATQWSWRRGVDAGILPKSVKGGKESWGWECPDKVEDFEDFGKSGLSESY